MNAYSQELDRFKVDINLADYAASMGYELDAKESSANSIIMRGPQDDKIVIARGQDLHWVYFSVRNDHDYGTIIDFHQNRSQQRLGETRKALRSWIGLGCRPISNPPVHSSYDLHPSTKDRQQVFTAYHRMKTPDHHPYLETRALGREILTHPRFTGRIRMDGKGNSVFPHFDQDLNLIGFEIKNRSFTGFSPGGQKGLWLSHQQANDENLVFCESAIDAISHYALYPDKNTRYASTAGRWGPNTEKLLRHISAHHPGLIVTLAFDRDEAGEELRQKAIALIEGLDKDIRTHLPRTKDWNQDLLEAYNT